MDVSSVMATRRRQAAAFVVAVAVWMFLWFRRRRQEARSVTYGPMLERDVQRQNNLRFIYESDDTRCVDLLRMRRAPFFQLCDLFRSRELLRDSIHSTIEEQVAMFLHVVGHNQRFRVINLTFRRSVETISRYFQEVLYAVGELRSEMIVPPSTNVHPKILNSRRWYPYFKDCIGAIDGTHVLARVPRRMQAAFMGRKHTTTQNVLAAVDFDLRFTYVLAGWEGSAHDALILADALVGMTGAVRDVAEAMQKPVQTMPAKDESIKDLYHATMSIGGFTQEALMFALSHMLDNRAQGLCFLEMTEEHRVLWLRTFLGKHYYN
ncbi:hypothetical protein ACP70R_024665 [Stipagrostis hirtigluma subsp. patula]